MVGQSRLSRGGARACAWTGRGSVLAAGAGAAMILFGGGPSSDLTPSQPLPTGSGGTEVQQEMPSVPGTLNENDHELLMAQLRVWDGPIPEDDETTTTLTMTPDTADAALTYLGIIKMGDRQRALMSVDGRQRFLREGQSVGQMTLVSIAEDHVMIREGSADRRLDRLAASADRLGYLGSNGPPVRLSDPGSFTSEMGMRDPSEARRRQIAERIERSGRNADAPPGGVPAAKARNATRARDLPDTSSDGQEGS